MAAHLWMLFQPCRLLAQTCFVHLARDYFQQVQSVINACRRVCLLLLRLLGCLALRVCLTQPTGSGDCTGTSGLGFAFLCAGLGCLRRFGLGGSLFCRKEPRVLCLACNFGSALLLPFVRFLGPFLRAIFPL